MSSEFQRKFYFKHLYGANPDEWGVIGFPRSQTPTVALNSYSSDGLVLLAIAKKPNLYPELSRGLRGKVFGVCTLYYIDRTTRDFGNPEMVRRYPEVPNKWPNATPIKKFWRFEHAECYDRFGTGELTRLVRNRRGHLIRLADYPAIDLDVRERFETAQKTAYPVYCSPKIEEHTGAGKDYRNR